MKYCAEIFTGNGYQNKYIGTIHADGISVLKRKASKLCNNYFNIYDRMEVLETEVRTDADGNTRIIEYHAVFRRFNKKHPNNTIERDLWR